MYKQAAPTGLMMNYAARRSTNGASLRDAGQALLMN